LAAQLVSSPGVLTGRLVPLPGRVRCRVYLPELPSLWVTDNNVLARRIADGESLTFADRFE
jgi:hypothetical protein